MPSTKQGYVAVRRRGHASRRRPRKPRLRHREASGRNGRGEVARVALERLFRHRRSALYFRRSLRSADSNWGSIKGSICEAFSAVAQSSEPCLSIACRRSLSVVSLVRDQDDDGLIPLAPTIPDLPQSQKPRVQIPRSTGGGPGTICKTPAGRRSWVYFGYESTPGQVTRGYHAFVQKLWDGLYKS